MSSQEDRKQTGMIFNIQKFSVHDGPGIRTIAFLKGCSLTCIWCSNPESQRLPKDLAYNVGRCLTTEKCQYCLSACPQHAITANSEHTLDIDREKCLLCDMPCTNACPSQALLAYGEEKSVDEVLKTVEKDMVFYSRSGGGLTLSGGEPLYQKGFSVALLREAKKRRIKTAIETCGMVPWEHFEQAAPYIDYTLFDIKHMNSEKHKEYTGKGNEIILSNFKKYAELQKDKQILCRTPIIPNFNNNVEDIKEICNFIKPFENVKYEPLEYHRLGTQKYTFLNRKAEMGEVQLDKSIMQDIVSAVVEILGKDRLVYV